jgi:hypothetical protein
VPRTSLQDRRPPQQSSDRHVARPPRPGGPERPGSAWLERRPPWRQPPRLDAQRGWVGSGRVDQHLTRPSLRWRSPGESEVRPTHYEGDAPDACTVPPLAALGARADLSEQVFGFHEGFHSGMAAPLGRRRGGRACATRSGNCAHAAGRRGEPEPSPRVRRGRVHPRRDGARATRPCTTRTRIGGGASLSHLAVEIAAWALSSTAAGRAGSRSRAGQEHADTAHQYWQDFVEQ